MENPDALSDLEFLVMLAVIRLGPEAYGIPIARDIEVRGRRSIMLGSIYAVLDRLEAKGLVSSELGQATEQRGGRAKRYFRETLKGMKAVRATRESMVRMWRGIPKLNGGIA